MRKLCFFLVISFNVLFCQTKLPVEDSVQNFLFSQSVKKLPIIITTNGIFERDKKVLDFFKSRSIPVATVIGGGYSKDPKELAPHYPYLN